MSYLQILSDGNKHPNFLSISHAVPQPSWLHPALWMPTGHGSEGSSHLLCLILTSKVQLCGVMLNKSVLPVNHSSMSCGQDVILIISSNYF